MNVTFPSKSVTIVQYCICPPASIIVFAPRNALTSFRNAFKLFRNALKSCRNAFKSCPKRIQIVPKTYYNKIVPKRLKILTYLLFVDLPPPVPLLNLHLSYSSHDQNVTIVNYYCFVCNLIILSMILFCHIVCPNIPAWSVH